MTSNGNIADVPQHIRDSLNRRPHSGEPGPLLVDSLKIAQTAIQSIGMDTRDPWGPPKRLPEYALAVSLIFTKATNQTIILGTPPKHVLSTSILWSSLAHDKRFTQIPMSDAAPGDIIIASHPSQADGYAGIVVDHGRIVSNSSQGVQNYSSLIEIQRNRQEMAIFRYIGVQGPRSYPLANAGYNDDEARLPEQFQPLGVVSRLTVSMPEACIQQGWNLHLRGSPILAPIQWQK